MRKRERDEEVEGGPQGVRQHKGDTVKNRKPKKDMKEGEETGMMEAEREEAWESNPPPFYAK